MNSARIIFHLARADFYERLRRYSFLIMLGLSVFLGYQVAIGNLTLTLSQYRGEFNSAWVGAMVSLVATFFLGWFGFYLVKGSVGRDRDTGVGQIMATTPITRPVYMLGKWLSNFCVLMAMIGVLAVMGIAIQLWQGESFQIDVWAYLSPFLLIVLPCMALVAAFAVLFEAIPFLQGGFGNIAYFILFVASFPVIFENLETTAVFEPFGIGIMEMDMGKAVAAVYPDYIGGFSLGPAEFIKDTFVWEGVQWTPALILARTSLVVVSVLMVLTAALFFDRFDPARSTLRLAKRRVQVQKDGVVEASPVAVAKSMPMVHLSPLSQAARRYHFLSVLVAEVKLLVKGQRWWWYAIAGVLILACLLNPSAATRELALPLAWTWPVLIWSALGSREKHHNIQQITFSSAFPVGRQLPAQWLAGLLVTLLMGSGALLRFLLDGDTVGLLALFSGALFIPSLALAAGVWGGTSKLFEVLYVTLLYMGPFNHLTAVDFIGASGDGRPEFFIPLSLALLIFAVLGRMRQVQR